MTCAAHALLLARRREGPPRDRDEAALVWRLSTPYVRSAAVTLLDDSAELEKKRQWPPKALAAAREWRRQLADDGSQKRAADTADS